MKVQPKKKQSKKKKPYKRYERLDFLEDELAVEKRYRKRLLKICSSATLALAEELASELSFGADYEKAMAHAFKIIGIDFSEEVQKAYDEFYPQFYEVGYLGGIRHTNNKLVDAYKENLKSARRGDVLADRLVLVDEPTSERLKELAQSKSEAHQRKRFYDLKKFIKIDLKKVKKILEGGILGLLLGLALSKTEREKLLEKLKKLLQKIFSPNKPVVDKTVEFEGWETTQVGSAEAQIEQGEEYFKFETMRDDKVCHRCENLRGTTVSASEVQNDIERLNEIEIEYASSVDEVDDERFAEYFGSRSLPPVHPNCRCFLVPV